MTANDVYRITDTLDDATLNAIEARLEARGKHPRFMQMMDDYLDAMNIDAAQRVLDVGCGTGVAARAIARRPKFAGQVVGIDRSPHFIAAATRIAKSEGLADKVAFHAGDSHTLKLRDAEFDAVVAHTLLSHVDNAKAVLDEMLRVVKRIGTVCVFDGDYASLTFAGDNAEETRIMDEAIGRAIVTNPRVMRQLPQLIREAGAHVVTSFAYVVADMGRADFFAPAVKSFVTLLPKAGAITELDAADWAATMMRRSEEGTFFAASNYYSYVATKR